MTKRTKKNRERTALVAALSSSMIFIIVILVLVLAGIGLNHSQKYHKPSEEEIQRNLELAVENYMKNNLRDPKGYRPGNTEILMANMIDGRPTMEMESTLNEYDIVAAGIRAKLDNPAIPMSTYENEITRLDSLDKVIRQQKENNKIQDGWILQHSYTVRGEDLKMWLICNNEKTAVTGVARDYILSLLLEAYQVKELEKNKELNY